MSEKLIDPNELGEEIVRVIKTIFDPEIPVDIYELGLIYDVLVNEDNDVKVLMTLTTPNCPVAESLPLEVKNKITDIDIVVFDIKCWLKDDLILVEKDFREKVSSFDWSSYNGKNVAIQCSNDAIIPH